MKEKLRIQKSQSIREIPTKINYSGERSPHWDFVNKMNYTNDDGTITEHVRANPDSLSEEDSLYYRPLSEEGRAQYELVEEIMMTLPRQQRRVMELCGFNGMTFEAAAKEMGLSIWTVVGYFKRAKAKIQRAYRRLEKDS